MIKKIISFILLMCFMFCTNTFVFPVAAEGATPEETAKYELLKNAFLTPYPGMPYNSLNLSSGSIGDIMELGVHSDITEGFRVCAENAVSDENASFWNWNIGESGGQRYLYHEAADTGTNDASNDSVRYPCGLFYANSGNDEKDINVKTGSEAYEKMGFQFDFKLEAPQSDVGYFTKFAASDGNRLLDDTNLITIYDASEKEVFDSSAVKIAGVCAVTNASAYGAGYYMINVTNTNAPSYDYFMWNKALVFGQWYTAQIIAEPKTDKITVTVYDETGNKKYDDSFNSVNNFDSVSSLMEMRGSRGADTCFKNLYTAAELLYIEEAPRIVKENGRITATAKIANDSVKMSDALKGEDVNSPILVLAVYDKQGRLKKTETASKVLKARSGSRAYRGHPVSEELSISVDGYSESEYDFKAFLFKDMASVKPLTSKDDSIEEKETLLNELIIKNSLVLKSGVPYYYDGGSYKEYMLEDSSYVPLESDGDIYLPDAVLSGMGGFDISYNASSDTITISGEGKTVLMKPDEKYITVNGVRSSCEAPAIYTDGIAILPAGTVFEALGFGIKKQGGLHIVINDSVITESPGDIPASAVAEAEKLFDERILFEDFNSSASQMSFGSWGGDNSGHGYTVDEETGSRCAWMNATTAGWEGFRTVKLKRGTKFDRKDAAYKISFSYKVSTDFGNSALSVGLFYYDGDQYKTVSNVKTFNASEKDKWLRETVYIPGSLLPNVSRSFNYDSVSVIIRNFPASGSGSVTGSIKLDDVHIEALNSFDGVVDAHMLADKYAAWYTLGDTVTYKPKYTDVLASASTLKATVYDYYGGTVNTSEMSAESVAENGWSYTPQDNGWYEVEFTAVLRDGRELPVVTAKSYLTNTSEQIGYSYLTRTEFFVTRSGTKAHNERNETLFFSSNFSSAESDYTNDFVKLANLLGFHGNRWISLDWGERPNDLGGVSNGVETVKGAFDWSVPDAYFEFMHKYGFDDNIVCVMTTPRWATVPDSEMRDSSGKLVSPTETTVTGMYVYNNYMAKNTDEWTNFIRRAAERYKDEIDIWEIWNEPMDAKSAFWYDTPANYIRMLSSAYDTLKSVDPDIKVSTAGMGNNKYYTRFLQKMINTDPTILDKMDYYAVHGSYDTISNIKEIISESGHAPIPWINTEGYYGAAGADVSADEKASNAIKNYIKQYEMGAKITTFFNMLNIGYEVEDIERLDAESDYSPFRYYPYITPKKLAASMHTFFELMEKDFSVLREYEFENGLHGVLCNNGDKKLMVMWNSDGRAAVIPNNLAACLKSGGSKLRMDGRITSSLTVPSGQVVYLTDMDMDLLDESYGPNPQIDVSIVSGKVNVSGNYNAGDQSKSAYDKMLTLTVKNAGTDSIIYLTQFTADSNGDFETSFKKPAANADYIFTVTDRFGHSESKAVYLSAD